jgi:SOS response regulatory protein OraA/RecX
MGRTDYSDILRQMGYDGGRLEGVNELLQERERLGRQIGWYFDPEEYDPFAKVDEELMKRGFEFDKFRNLYAQHAIDVGNAERVA